MTSTCFNFSGKTLVYKLWFTEFVEWTQYTSTQSFKIVTGIQPNVGYIFAMSFVIHIVFKNCFELKSIRNYHGINLFEDFHTNLIKKNLNQSLFRKD